EIVRLRFGLSSGVPPTVTILMIVGDVVVRIFFSYPMLGPNEQPDLVMVGRNMLRKAAAQQKNHNFSIELLTTHLPPAGLRVARFISTVASTVVCGLLAWLTIDIAHSMTLSNESSYGVIAFPIWPSRIILAVGLVCRTLPFVCDHLRVIGLIPEQQAEEEKASL